jgi:hypothetical protein
MLLSVRQREILWVGPELNWPVMVRAKVASLDQSLVDRFVQTHISELKNMGKYEQLSKSQQCDGDALAGQTWLPDLINLCPTLEFPSTTPFKKEFLAQLVKTPALNETKMRGDLWASHRADRILTVCYHMRKVKRCQFELQRLAGTAAGHNFEQLKKMIDSMPQIPVNEILPISEKKDEPMDTPEELTVADEKGSENSFFASLYPETSKPTPAKKSPTPKVTPTKVSLVKSKVVEATQPYYRKEFYKASNAFGFKRHCKGCKPKQIFSLASKKLSVEVFGAFASKVLGSLNSMEPPSETEEQRIWLLAKFKLGKLEQGDSA